MSYRNPKQIVDTQSGQHIRDMQKSLADTFSKYSSSINTIIKKQAEEEAEASELARAKVNKYSNKVSGDINQLANKNKPIDFSAFVPWLDVTSNIIKKQPHTWNEKDRNTVNNMNRIGTDAADNLANTVASGETYVEARNLPLFTEGAVYSGFTNSEEEMTPEERAKYIDNSYKKLDILYGIDGAPGSKSYEVDPTGLRTEFKTIIYDENGVEIGSSRNSTIDSLDLPVIIPKEKKNMQQLVKQTAASMDLNSITSIAYKDQESIEVPLSKDPANTKFQSSKKPSRALFLELAYEDAFANIKALPADEAIAYNNDILKKYNNPIKMRKKWVGGTEEQIALDKKDLQSIAKAYAQYAADTPEGRAVLNKSKDFGVTIRKPKYTKEGIGSGSDFYNKIKKDPTSYFNEYTEIPAILDEKKNTITIPKKYLEEGKDEEDLVIDMNNKQSKISFYTRILEASGIAKGTSEKAKLIRKQFSEAIRADKLKKQNPKNKELEEFQKEWNKKNPDIGPVKEEQSFRFARMMNDYNEYKKNKNQ